MNDDAKIQQFRELMQYELRNLEARLDLGKPTADGDIREYLNTITRLGALSRLYVDFEKMMREEAA